MINELTQEMADQFNENMRFVGSSFIVLKEPGNDYAWRITLPVDPFEKERPMVYPNQSFYELLERHYRNYGMKLHYNNTKSIFWAE